MFLDDPKNSLDTRQSAIGAAVVDISTGDHEVTKDGYCPVPWITRGLGNLHVLTAQGDDVIIPLGGGAPGLVPIQIQKVIKVGTSIHPANIFVLY
jgi:hypothetical protein